MNATIRDVASAAGVSASTVSRAFGRPEKVEEDTRRRIFQVAEELGYRPNRAAQSLITGRTGNIGIVVPDVDNPFFSGIVKGAQTPARECGYSVLLADADEDPAVEYQLAGALSRQVDGLVLCSSRIGEARLREIQRACPVVLVNRRVVGVPGIAIDNADAMRQAVAHLRALRHRRVGYVAGPGTSHSNLERQKAVEAQLTAAGLTYVLVGAFDPSFEGGRGAADEVLLADVSAVIVYNDLMAIGLISQLTSYGVQIPTELSVIGCDDIPFAGMFTPALTTVRIPREQAGRYAVEYLHGLIDAGGEPAHQPRELATELVVRSTTARAHAPTHHGAQLHAPSQARARAAGPERSGSS